MQKGSAQIFIILLAVVLILTGVFFFSQKLNKNDLQISPQIISPAETLNTHTDQGLGFELSYPKEMVLKIDTEEEYNKRGNGDFRKNFKSYVGYEPGKFIGAVVVLGKDGNYDTNPFTVWVFDNPENLSIDKWYGNFWYYPFVWGDFTYTGKFTMAPKIEATISGQLAKSGIIDYQDGKPEFIYLVKDERMYLIRIIKKSTKEVEQILTSFKLLD